VVDVKYAEMDITGSPFCVDVFDPSQVRVGHMPQGILGKCFQFERKSLHSIYLVKLHNILALLLLVLMDIFTHDIMVAIEERH